jgi:hypothetical protein
MIEMLRQLKPILSRRDKIGYVAARNCRILTDALTEHEAFKNSLIEKYGEQDKDENGNGLPTISVKMGSPRFHEFCKELEPFNNMEHEIDLMIAKYEDAIGNLSGEEILAVDWMFEE